MINTAVMKASVDRAAGEHVARLFEIFVGESSNGGLGGVALQNFERGIAHVLEANAQAEGAICRLAKAVGQ